MKDYLVGCLYAPTAMSTLAILAYLFMYKKNYSTKTLGILYLTIMLVSVSTGLAVSIVLTNLLNLQTFYLTALGFVTGFFICHLLGLTNKNLKKLTQAKKAMAPRLWRSYKKALKKHTKTTLRKKLKYHYPIIGIGCLLAIMAVISLLDYWSAVNYDNNLEKYVACQAITLPKKLKTNYIFESISKQGKNIYTTFTLEDELSEKITPFFFKKIQSNALMQSCLTNDNNKRQLKDYTYIHIINVANKKDAFRISIDQAACNNFLKDYQINRQ